MAIQSQPKTQPKGKGVILRDAAAVVAIVTTLLLSADRAFARDISFTWTPNTDHTEGYNLYVREAGVADWPPPVAVLNGREIATWTGTFLVGVQYEVTITAWSDTYEGQPITYQESDMAPAVMVSADEGVPYILNVQGFTKE